MNCFNSHDEHYSLIPEYIKNKIISKYLFKDVVRYHTRFFTQAFKNDEHFIADICTGLMPRRFRAADPQDRVILEEDQDAAEMYFVQTGLVAIAFHSFQSSLYNPPYKEAHRRRGIQLICDHYVLNKRRSTFSYIAVQDVSGFGLPSDFMFNRIEPVYGDYFLQMQGDSRAYYMSHIFRPFMKTKN